MEDAIGMGKVPRHLRLLFAELGINTPVYGIVQSGGNQDLKKLLKDIVKSRQKVTQNIHSETMLLLLEHVPVIGKIIILTFLSGCPDTLMSGHLQTLVPFSKRVTDHLLAIIVPFP